jgi:hypothetical protein
MTGYRQSPGFAARRDTRPAVRSDRQLRGDWVQAVDAARDVLRDGADDGFRENSFLRLVQALRHIEPGNFPIGSYSARQMATAFLAVARLYAAPEVAPETRTACADSLEACARVLDGMLTGLRDGEAQGWRGRTGERED